MWKEAREDLDSTSQARLRTALHGWECIPATPKQMCKGAQDTGLCQKEGAQTAAGLLLGHLMERSCPELQVQSTKPRAQRGLSPQHCSGAETTQNQPSSQAAAAGCGGLCEKLSYR